MIYIILLSAIISLLRDRILKKFKLLKLFASRKNEILERDRLLKEIWEDEGIFVGRSLDMFVSKLRKKLLLDPSTNLKNIKGRGCILHVD